MNDLRDRLLGRGSRDPGCEECFEVLDQYAEALVRGVDVGRRFPEVVAHLAGCAACREDAVGLIAALRSETPPDERR
jgi:hypothetical protein